MKIQQLNSNEISSKGLYFTRTSNVLFNNNPRINFANPKDYVKVSERGARYIEDKVIPQNIKDRFASAPFIKNLAEKFDIFVFFKELPIGHPSNLGTQHFSFAKISWADYTKEINELRVVHGNSPLSQEYATNNMFTNLKNEKFAEIA